MSSKLTGFDLMTFVSEGHMSIRRNGLTNEITFHTSPELPEIISELVGFEVSGDTLNEMLAHFAEFASTASYTLKKKDD